MWAASGRAQSCVRLKLICKQVINALLGGEVDFGKVQRLIPKERGFTLSDARVRARPPPLPIPPPCGPTAPRLGARWCSLFSWQAAVAATHFILENAARYGVDFKTLGLELQQLGLPRENSDGIARPYRINRDLLRTRLLESRVSLPRLEGVDWRVDWVVAGSSVERSAGGVCVPSLRLRLSHTRDSRRPPKTPLRARLALDSSSSSSASSSSSSSVPSPFAARAAPLIFSAAAPLDRVPESVPGPVVSFSLTADDLLALVDQLRRAQDSIARLDLAGSRASAATASATATE
jgi:hypothetical protein